MQKISEAIVAGSLEHIAEDSKREKEIKEEFGAQAKHVDLYAPNRKQRRAQAAAKRKNKSKVK